MRDPPPAVPGHAALDPVLARGLAKEADDRYETCAALIDAAYEPRSARGMRGRHVILAAGVVLLAAVVAAALGGRRRSTDAARGERRRSDRV